MNDRTQALATTLRDWRAGRVDEAEVAGLITDIATPAHGVDGDTRPPGHPIDAGGDEGAGSREAPEAGGRRSAEPDTSPVSGAELAALGETERLVLDTARRIVQASEDAAAGMGRFDLDPAARRPAVPALRALRALVQVVDSLRTRLPRPTLTEEEFERVMVQWCNGDIETTAEAARALGLPLTPSEEQGE